VAAAAVAADRVAADEEAGEVGRRVGSLLPSGR
jgi:hypothetical protein